jgi:hypothetical protein
MLPNPPGRRAAFLLTSAVLGVEVPDCLIPGSSLTRVGGPRSTRPAPSEAVRQWDRVGLVAIKAVHTAAFFSIGSCLIYLAYSGIRKRSDRRAAIAGLVVTAEALIYAANGFRCPLTDLAERLGSEHGSVADIYLPRWIESHLPLITGPIFAGALILHAKNVIESCRARSSHLRGMRWQ